MKKSTHWKDVAELIGILAIVASLVSVAFQLRQTQSALTASTFQERAFDAIAEDHFVAESEFLLPILVKTNYGETFEEVAKLNELDRARLMHFMRSRMIDWGNEFYQYQQGYLDEGFFEVTTIPSVRMWAPRWRAMGMTEGRGEYRDFVDSVLAGEGSDSN